MSAISPLHWGTVYISLYRLAQHRYPIATRNATLLEEIKQLRQQLWALRGENEHIKGLTVLIGNVRNQKEPAESFWRFWSIATCTTRGELSTSEVAVNP